MAVRIVRLGSPRVEGEGLRLGTVRRPPRGVPKADFARRDFYDVWLPLLSPEPELVKTWLQAEDDATLTALRDGYRAGIPTAWGTAERDDAAKVYDILAKLGGRELVGDSPHLAAGTFWPGSSF